MAEGTSSSSKSGSSGAAVKDKDRYGGDEPLDYPTHEPLDKVTYRDPRPLDWPQKADRSVYIGVVLRADGEDTDKDPKGDYVHAGQVHDDEELEVGGTAVTDAQVISGGGQLNLILNGQVFTLGGLGDAVSGELQRALQVNANS
jgi:hypothetical protein